MCINLKSIRKSAPILAIAAATCIFASCSEKDLYEGPINNPDSGVINQFFDYKTTQAVDVNLDFGFESQMRFEIYDKNPYKLTADGVQAKDNSITPVAMSFTDSKGKFNGKLILPVSLKDAYIYTDYIVAPRILTTNVSGRSITATKNNELVLTNATSSTRAAAILKGALKLDADCFGTMTAADLKAAQAEASKVYTEGKSPVGLTTYDTDFFVEKEAVTIEFISGTTGADNNLYYFCYPATVTPTADYIKGLKKALVWSSVAQGQNTKFGSTATLPFINANGELENAWPKGYKIGFMLDNNNAHHYSTPLDVAYFDMASTFTYGTVGNETVVFGLEDWYGGAPTYPFDYNDVIFQLRGIAKTIDPTTSESEYTFATQGLLAFEDNWPNKGDYDMNDVVLKYTSKQTYFKKVTNDHLGTITSEYTKGQIVDEFELIWSGADYKNGFGYYVELDADVNIEGITLNGKAIGDKLVESGNGYIIYLFNNAKAELGVENVAALDMPNTTVASKTYTVVIPYNKVAFDLTEPPYGNKVGPAYKPFITQGGNKGHEIHLIDNKPTAAHMAYNFGQFDDCSNGTSTFYRSETYLPYALCLNADGDNADVLNINLKPETVAIYETYNGFEDWANGLISKWW